MKLLRNMYSISQDGLYKTLVLFARTVFCCMLYPMI
jgi:hypothetical protein